MFASLGSWIPCATLILLSDLMLHVPLLIIVVHQLTCMLLCLGLSSIAVGFGAMMPNFRETSPSKIAAGFGGTLNLVLERAVHHGDRRADRPALPLLSARRQRAVARVVLEPDFLRLWLWGGSVTAIVVGISATVLPLWWGLRSFRQMEFN